MNLDDIGKRLESIENEFTKVWNSDVPDWMVRDANIKRHEDVGILLKDIVNSSKEKE